MEVPYVLKYYYSILDTYILFNNRLKCSKFNWFLQDFSIYLTITVIFVSHKSSYVIFSVIIDE